MRSRTPGAMIVAALAAAVLAGCGTPGGAPPTTEPDPIVTEELPPDPDGEPDDPATWQISVRGIGPVLIDADFDNVIDELRHEWTSPESCDRVAFWNAPEGGYTVSFSRGEPSAAGQIELVAVSVPADGVRPVGPVTAEGIGIGSTKEQVREEYPHAEEGGAAIGDGSSWMRILDDADDDAAIFVQYAPDAEEAYGVVVTTLPEPPYEQCG